LNTNYQITRPAWDRFPTIGNPLPPFYLPISVCRYYSLGFSHTHAITESFRPHFAAINIAITDPEASSWRLYCAALLRDRRNIKLKKLFNDMRVSRNKQNTDTDRFCYYSWNRINEKYKKNICIQYIHLFNDVNTTLSYILLRCGTRVLPAYVFN